jgi:hypothetical protein
MANEGSDMREIQIPVTEIREGDAFTQGGGWVARRAAEWDGGNVTVEVEYSDGGIGVRTWDNPDRELVVTRG